MRFRWGSYEIPMMFLWGSYGDRWQMSGKPLAYSGTNSKKRLLPNKELTLQREIRIMLLTITETTFRFANIARGKENKAWCQQVYKSKKESRTSRLSFCRYGKDTYWICAPNTLYVFPLRWMRSWPFSIRLVAPFSVEIFSTPEVNEPS